MRRGIQFFPLTMCFVLSSTILFVNACSDRTVHFQPAKNSPESKSPIQRIDPILIDDARNENLTDSSAFTAAMDRPSVSKRNLRPRFTDILNKTDVKRELFYRDGTIDNYLEFRYDPTNGKLTRRTWYIGIGADNIWFTDDDIVSSNTEFQPSITNVIEIRYAAAGPDQTWFTEDDIPEIYKAELLDANGNIVAEAFRNMSGTDGIWFTDDDATAWIEINTTTPNNEKAWVKYVTAGPDNDWLTLDDNVIAEFVVSEENINGDLISMKHYGSVGPDALLFTSDDVLRTYRTYSYDAQNEIFESTFYGDPGADLIWFTADDLIRTCRQLQRDTNGVPYRTVTVRPGVDEICFTADDVVRGYHDDKYDANNSLVKSLNFVMPGTDSIWFTDDDILGSEKLFTVQ